MVETPNAQAIGQYLAVAVECCFLFLYIILAFEFEQYDLLSCGALCHVVQGGSDF